MCKLLLVLSFLLVFSFSASKIPQPVQKETVEEYFSYVIDFLNWQKKVDSIEIELKQGTFYPEMEYKDYVKKVIPQVVNHDKAFYRSYIVNVKSNHSYHIFPDFKLTNDCWVSFFPEHMMVSAKVVFPPENDMYFYDINFFFRTAVSNKDGITYSGVLNSYSKNVNKGLTFVTFPIKVKVKLTERI